MSEERLWNTDEYASTAKFAVSDGAMTMRQAGRIFRLDPAPPKVEDINDYIVSAIREQDNTYFTYFLHQYESRLNKRVYRFLLTEKTKKSPSLHTSTKQYIGMQTTTMNGAKSVLTFLPEQRRS